MLQQTLFFSALLLLGSNLSPGDEWPSFRGPTGMGVTKEKDLPLTWSAEENLLWKSPLPPTSAEADPDHNQSSPVVADGKVIVTTCHWAKGTAKNSEAPEHHIACYDAASGALVWDSTVPQGPLKLQDLRGGYAVPTPAIADGRIFAYFGSGIIHALDMDGKKLWSYTIPKHDKFDVAIAASPLVYKNLVILLLERKKPDATLIALDAVSGEVKWEKDRPESDFSHVTPVLADINGGVQLLVPAAKTLQGIDPTSGEVIWSCKWDRQIWPVSSPVMTSGLVYAIGGRGGHPGVVVDPTGKGDVTETHLKYNIGPMSEGLSSPVAFGDYVFRLNSPGLLRCTRIADGEEMFRERLPDIDHAVSPFVTPNGHIYFASAGKSVVIEAGPEFKILAESDLRDPCKSMAAISGSRIFLKGHKYLWAIGKK